MGKAPKRREDAPSQDVPWAVNPWQGFRQGRAVGFWWSTSEPDLPRAERFVDPTWDRATRARVVAYLERLDLVPPVVACGFSRCRFCSAVNGSREMWDGTFQWPSGLCHYVRDHDVRLHDAFVAHVLADPDRPRPELRDLEWLDVRDLQALIPSGLLWAPKSGKRR